MRHFVLLAVLAACVASVFGQFGTLPRCSNLYIRREWRSLSSTQRARFFRAVRTLYDDGFFNTCARAHIGETPRIHNKAVFLPYHRAFLKNLENAINRVEPGFGGLPYWNWSLDSQAPERSPVLSSNAFGSNGTGSSRCVTNGHVSYMRPTTPTTHCLRRAYDNGTRINALASPEAMSLLVYGYSSFNSFSRILEGTHHGALHLALGGEMREMHSPNDPLFWLHHCYMDKLWRDFQFVHPSNAYDYGRTGENASLDDPLPVYRLPVGAVFNNRGPYMCYEYDVAPVNLHSGSNTLEKRSASVGELFGKLVDKNIKNASKLLKALKKDNTRKGKKSEECGHKIRRALLAKDDRHDLCGLRKVEKLPAAFSEKMKLPTGADIDDYVAKANDLLYALNETEDYVSPACLAVKVDEGEIVEAALDDLPAPVFE